MLNIVLFLGFVSIYNTKAAVLLWSTTKLSVSPLNVFTDETLDDLIEKLNNPELTIYKSTSVLLPEFETFLDGYYTAYNPNGEVNTENATEINSKEDLVLLDAKQREDLSKSANTLSVVVIPSVSRHKREVNELTTTEGNLVSVAKGPVLYRGKSTQDVYSLLYSSQPLVLRTFNSSIELGEGILVTIDKQSKNASIRLDATVPVGEEKYILQFSFTWQSTYWSLSTVKVKSTLSNSSVNLFISETFSVPARFSYHCTGTTVFSDVDKTTELLIFDMQAQPDSRNGLFGDVYDCVDFTTVPIWSGLFVSGLLGGGLILALIAINEIKTMDKFDNQKTKQLAITVTE